VGAVSPTGDSTNWTTQAIACGAGYSLAPSIPVGDLSTLIYMSLLYAEWCRGAHIETIVGELGCLGRSPHALRDRWELAGIPEPTRARGLAWLSEASTTEVDVAMSAFGLASA